MMNEIEEFDRKKESEYMTLPNISNIVYGLGWICALSLLFWIIMFIVYAATNKKYHKFLNPATKKVVRGFGYIVLSSFIFMIIVVIAGLMGFI